MEEIWKDIKGYEGLYQVSNLGRVKSFSHIVRCRNGKRIQPGKTLTGAFDGNYLHVTLFKNGKRKICFIHRLVASTFIDNPYDLPQVNHKDGNKMNNNVKNLEWCSARDNLIHAFKLGLKTAQITHYRGVKAFKDGNFVGEYKSLHEAAKKLNLNVGHICGVLHGRSTNFKGFYFEYNNKEKLQNRIY